MTIARRFLYDTRRRRPARGAGRRVVGAAGRARREARSARSAITGCTPAPGSTAWPGADGEPRDRLLAALAELGPDAATVFTPLPGEPALLEAGILAAPMTELETRWRAAIEPVFASLDLPMPPPAARPGARPARPRRGVPLAVGRVHLGPPLRSRGDLVSEVGDPDRRRADPRRADGRRPAPHDPWTSRPSAPPWPR